MQLAFACELHRTYVRVSALSSVADFVCRLNSQIRPQINGAMTSKPRNSSKDRPLKRHTTTAAARRNP